MLTPQNCLPVLDFDPREKWKGNYLNGAVKICQLFVSRGDGQLSLAHLLFASFCFLVKTKADGSFRLENITTGTYTIHAQKEHLYFETVTIKIAPNTPQLADIIATG